MSLTSPAPGAGRRRGRCRTPQRFDMPGERNGNASIRGADAELDRQVRFRIYRHFAATGGAPTTPGLASAVDRPVAEVEESIERLAAARAIVLAPGTKNVWMAHPFSAVETDYKVHANGKVFWANCAWDALGIPAALQVDAEVEARYAGTGEKTRLRVPVTGPDTGERIHFLLPFAHWYDDLVFT